MNPRKAGGHAKPAARSATAKRADALMVDLALTPAAAAGWCPASSCKPNQPALVVRWLVATAALARTVRWPFPGVSVRIPKPFPEGAPSARSTDASIELALSNSSGGLSMAKIARDLIYPALKSFPVNDLGDKSAKNMGEARNCMILQSYTLCEVLDGKRQSVPPRVSPNNTLLNRNLRPLNRTTSTC